MENPAFTPGFFVVGGSLIEEEKIFPKNFASFFMVESLV